MATGIAPSPALGRFRLPRDLKALVSFLIAAVGGAVVAFFPGPPDAASVWLLLSMAGLVLVSEWISNLMGRGADGAVSPASPRDVRGIAVGAACIALLLAFLWRLPPGERRAWAAVLAALGSGVALLFLLRIEWVPLDRRLIALTHLLLTAPCLLLGFRAWGIGAPRAFTAWAPLALFLPSVALVERAWMDGPNSARNAPDRRPPARARRHGRPGAAGQLALAAAFRAVDDPRRRPRAAPPRRRRRDDAELPGDPRVRAGDVRLDRGVRGGVGGDVVGGGGWGGS
ncbi:MAG: hypothetical protein U0470_02575 [Anaerolineae bacterium]